MIVAIDGPAASGKSSAGRELSRRLGFYYLDSGAIYRYVALQGEPDHRLPEGWDKDPALFSEETGKKASEIGKNPSVRSLVGKLMRTLCENKNAIVVGRDIGTVVFPDAEYKFYLTASLEQRAKRRLLDVKEKAGADLVVEMEKKLHERDAQDASRPVAPLCIAKEAVLIDSSELTLSEVVDQMERIVLKKNEFRKKSSD